MNFPIETPWYIDGLHFQCQQCGNCCCGPQEGYVWLMQEEINLIADMLKISREQVLQKYCRQIEAKISLIEWHDNKDCVFLCNQNSRKHCLIYNVRPSQCRKWPFWFSSFNSKNAWDKAAEKCPGMNKGRLYGFEEIGKIFGVSAIL